MVEPRLHSDSWYRVSDCRPALRPEVRIQRHRYRGELWYVIDNPAHRRVHRFRPEAYEVLLLVDGSRTTSEIWELSQQRLGDNAPSQDEVIQLLAQLSEADALVADVFPDGASGERVREQQARKRKLRFLGTPLMWRVPLADPQPWLDRLGPRATAMFCRAGFIAWTVLVAVAGLAAAVLWPELTHNLSDRVLAPSNLLVLVLLFPVLKLIHELGHALAVKAFGGEVRELGILFLVFTPIPYVDASQATAFRSKRERIIVGAAGMMFELAIASGALLLWAWIDAGVFRALLFNVMFIAGVTTLLFNANPFLRFDGYAILSDIVEIPNLARRGQAHLRYWFERTVLGNKRLPGLRLARGERRLLLGHAIGSIVCRAVIMTSIVLFVSSQFFTLGLLLAAWAVVVWLLIPMGRGLVYLFQGPSLAEVRGRAIGVSAALLLFMIAALWGFPLPYRSVAEGVIWVPDEAMIRASTDGFVVHLIANPGQEVRRGEPLLQCADPILETEVRVLEAQLAQLEAQRDARWMSDRVASDVLEEEIERVSGELDTQRQRAQTLTVTSPCDGTFLIARASDLPGRHLRKGQLIGHVLDPEDIVARVVVPQSDVDLVRSQTRGTSVRLCERPGRVVAAELGREVPEASRHLPSAALGTFGGGRIAVDPTDAEGLSALDKVFQFDVRFPTDGSRPHVGGRVLVRFDHGWQPLAGRWFRSVRRMWEDNRG